MENSPRYWQCTVSTLLETYLSFYIDKTVQRKQKEHHFFSSMQSEDFFLCFSSQSVSPMLYHQHVSFLCSHHPSLYFISIGSGKSRHKLFNSYHASQFILFLRCIPVSIFGVPFSSTKNFFDPLQNTNCYSYDYFLIITSECIIVYYCFDYNITIDVIHSKIYH